MESAFHRDQHTSLTAELDGLWGWSRELWDPAFGLVANPPGGYVELGPFAGRHLIRETAWFALDALSHGETALAVRALTTVVGRQYDRPGEPWHGTFPIFEHDPEPGEGAIMWLSYDPNWRQFVGVALALIVDGYAERLPGKMVRACEAATERCVEGEPPDRIAASYTNPALMHAWLADWVGRRTGQPSVSGRGQALAAEVMALFDSTGTVSEFNSPTYDGVNLMAATLWATAGEPFRSWGRRLIDAMFDSLRFLYHPGLHNLCGPYTRAYGMDLGSRITLYGLWRLVAGGDRSCLPPLGESVEHSHDLFFASLIEWAVSQAPRPFPADDFTFPRRRSFALGGGRTATASLDQDVMIGAENGARKGVLWSQYVPGSVHWQNGGGPELNWLRVHAEPSCPVDCVVEGDGTLTVVPAAGASTPVVITTNAPTEWRATGWLRLGGRVSVSTPDGAEVEDSPSGRRITAGAVSEPVVITVDGER